MQNMENGGLTMPNEDYLTTLRCTWEDHPSENSYVSGNLFTTVRVASEEYLIAKRVTDRLLEMDEEKPVTILEQIPKL